MRLVSDLRSALASSGLLRRRSEAVRLVRDKLDRPRWRWLLGAIGSLAITLHYRQPCFIRWRNGAWLHHFRDATIPHPTCGGALPFKEVIRCAPVFLHKYTPRHGDVVFDVGAGVGTETLLFSRLVGPTGRVIALEAHPGTYGWLDRLCHHNGLTNVVQIQVAAAAHAGELGMTDLDDDMNNRLTDGDAPLRVLARPLDDVALALGINRVDFLKMNIEGAEGMALRGMEKLISRTRHVCVSCHDFLADAGGPESMRTKSDVCEFLVAHGFTLTLGSDSRYAWTRDYIYGENTRMDGLGT